MKDLKLVTTLELTDTEFNVTLSALRKHQKEVEKKFNEAAVAETGSSEAQDHLERVLLAQATALGKLENTRFTVKS